MPLQDESRFALRLCATIGLAGMFIWMWTVWIYPIPHTTTIMTHILSLNSYQKLIALSSALIALFTPGIARAHPSDTHIRRGCQVIGAIALCILPLFWLANIMAGPLPAEITFISLIAIWPPYVAVLACGLYEPLHNEGSMKRLQKALSQETRPISITFLAITAYYTTLCGNIILATIG